MLGTPPTVLMITNDCDHDCLPIALTIVSYLLSLFSTASSNGCGCWERGQETKKPSRSRSSRYQSMDRGLVKCMVVALSLRESLYLHSMRIHTLIHSSLLFSSFFDHRDQINNDSSYPFLFLPFLCSYPLLLPIT